ncbi:TPA: DUF1642 domain-containing protein [Streptococcus suis]|nr:DUF1642 domain-containing protein [Streptococcus suis]
MNKQYKVGDEVLVRGIVNSEVRNGGIHVLHDGIDAFYMLDQIHEPQTVVVPKFVADKIEYCKNAEGYGLFHAMDYCYQYKDSAEWLECNQETFARAWLFGYEVEQEKLYTVEIPDPNRPDIATFLYKENGKVFIGTDIFLDEVPNYKWKNEPENHLTESEIKQDFEWAWQFAVPVEEEE